MQSRIVGGIQTTIKDAPFFARLFVNGTFLCGGTLVAPRFVVTAAHCVSDKQFSIYSVEAGERTRYHTVSTSKVNRIILPKEYSKPEKGWDIAVLKLNYPLNGPHIKPTCLCNTIWGPNSNVQIYGQGKLNKIVNINSDQLRMATVQVIENYKCVNMYRDLINITKIMFCASVPGIKGTCDGDSGGPAIINGQFCGVISGSLGCAEYKYPTIFTNVMLARDFITSAIRECYNV